MDKLDSIIWKPKNESSAEIDFGKPIPLGLECNKYFIKYLLSNRFCGVKKNKTCNNL